MVDSGAIRKLRITPGLAISPLGDEVEVLADQTYDTTKEPTASADADGDDPMSSDVPIIDNNDSPVKFLAIRFKKTPTRMIRTAPSACDCGTSRIVSIAGFKILIQSNY